MFGGDHFDYVLARYNKSPLIFSQMELFSCKALEVKESSLPTLVCVKTMVLSKVSSIQLSCSF